MSLCRFISLISGYLTFLLPPAQEAVTHTTIMPSKRANVVRKMESKKRRYNKRRQQGLVFARFMDIEGELNKLPVDFRGMLLAFPHGPKPQFIVDPASIGGEMKAFAESVSAIIASDYFTLESLPEAKSQGSFTFEQFLTSCLPVAMNIVGSANLLSTSKNAHKDWVPIFEAMSEKAWDFTMKIVDMFWRELITQIFHISVFYSRLNGRVYWFKCPTRDQIVDLEPCIITLYSKMNQEERVIIDGQERRVFPVAWGVLDYKHATMDASLFGGKKDTQLPVYAQSHALHKLEERLPKLELTEYFLMASVTTNPVVTNTDNSSEYLIQCSINDMKVGYFVAKVIENKIIIQTFLFLTMQGTPEAKRLFDKLRLKRYDIEKLKLDSLNQFVETDIFDDPDLKQVLTECGCGDLARLREMIKVGSYEKVAESLKQTLRIDKGKETVHKPTAVSESLRSNLQSK